MEVLRNRTAISLYALRTKHSTFRSAIRVSYYSVSEQDVVWAACCLGINFATNERIIDHFWMLVRSLQRFSLRLDVLWKPLQRFRFAVRTKHSTFRSAIAVSHYFCFWTACCQGIKETSAKFENAVLVDVYNCLCLYRYFSRYSLRTKQTTFLSSTASRAHEVFIFLSRRDTSNSRVDFSTNGSSRPDRIDTIRRDICSFPKQLDFRQ